MSSPHAYRGGGDGSDNETFRSRPEKKTNGNSEAYALLDAHQQIFDLDISVLH
jgi:hypothetical protein